MHVIATAGHVDHGKSRLVTALTGIDPDRLEEEKRRGLTIDLGFAWLRLPSGKEVGIVDVPGHERFIKNMLAGVGATDIALFVVAANEGWQPQSQEHLDILDLLGFGSGIFVVTKSDTVSEQELSKAIADVSKRIAHTSLARSRVASVSAKTGEGLPDLVEQLDQLITAARPSPDLGRPRLWIDRVFSIKGSGTVVTGTLIEGSIEKDQEVEIVNKGLRARVRSIQSHRSEVQRIGPGNRTALNLVSVSPEKIHRGDVVSLPDAWTATKAFVAKVRFLDLGFDPTARGSFKVYLGSAELDCSITFVGPAPQRGSEGYALFRILSDPTIASFGDRIILRDSGRRRTIGGGIIIEPFAKYVGSPRSPDSLARAEARATASGPAGYLGVVLDEVLALRISEARSMTGLHADSLPGIQTKNFVMSKRRFADLTEEIIEQVRAYQDAQPVDPGIPRTQLAFESASQIADEVIEVLTVQGRLVPEGTFVRTPDHQPQTETKEALDLLNSVHEAGFSPPVLSELNQRFDPSLVRSLIRSGRLIQIDRDIVISSERLDELKQQVRALGSEAGGFTVASFRDRIGTSRKYAVPLLEYLDSKRFTIRQADIRILGPATGKGSSPG